MQGKPKQSLAHAQESTRKRVACIGRENAELVARIRQCGKVHRLMQKMVLFNAVGNVSHFSILNNDTGEIGNSNLVADNQLKASPYSC